MNKYKVLNQHEFRAGSYSIVPIRMEDRHLIRKWRNEQIYHLRQNKPLTEEDQDRYFNSVVSALFDQEQPAQILFSYLHKEECIGYGGLVHINWIDKNAEISFIMKTELEENEFDLHWSNFLGLMGQVGFGELDFHKVYLYAFDLRPHLYVVLEKNEYFKDAVLKDHCLIDDEFKDVVIYSKLANGLSLRAATIEDAEITYHWATNEKVRQYAFNKQKIEWESHLKWFEEKLKNNQCKYYLLFNGNQPVGSIRFDLNEKKEAMVSYLIGPDLHGRGLGQMIVQKGVKRLVKDYPDLQLIFGFVMKENIASIKIFERMGFSKDESDEEQYKFSKAI